VLGFLLGPARPWGRWPWKRPAWTAAGGRLRPAQNRHATPGTGSRTRLYRRRGGCGGRGLAGHRAAVARRRIGGTVCPSRRPGRL